MDRYDWIITVSSSTGANVAIYRFFGSIEETKEKLISLISEAENSQPENIWHFDDETKDEKIYTNDNGIGFELRGCAMFNNYYIEYTAKEFSHIEFLTERSNTES